MILCNTQFYRFEFFGDSIQFCCVVPLYNKDMTIKYTKLTVWRKYVEHKKGSRFLISFLYVKSDIQYTTFRRIEMCMYSKDSF